MPNDENRIILEFPASDVQLELGETITFDNISGFLNSDRVTYDDESLTEKISTMNSEIDSKADAGATSQALDAKADKVETEQALATKADKTFVDGEVARLDERIDALPDAMIFKGTLGVGGTITELPTASAENEGWTYKVITAGTYAGLYADVGDCFTCFEASENVFGWTISAEGDTDTDTWRAIKVNGVEKLGNGISSGNVDFEDTANVKFTFDGNGNKIKASLSGIDTSAQVDAKVAGLIDDEAASENKVYSSSKVVALLGNKANVDGEYNDMVVGNAKQLKSNVGENDKVPYLFRTSGGSIEIGESEEDTLVGGTVAFNQLAKNGNFATADNWTTYHSAKSVANNELTITVSSGESNGTCYQDIPVVSGHKYYISAFAKCGTAERVRITYNNAISGFTEVTSTSFQSTTKIAQANLSLLRVALTVYGDGLTGMAKNVNVFDLTQMFGSTIADYIYSLEQGTAGAGVAWFRSLFPKDYYAYNAGELMSVKATKHITTGFNQWDEEWEVGTIGWTGSNSFATDRIRSKNYIPCTPNTIYYAYKASSNGRIQLFYYDADKNFIKYEYSTVYNQTFTTPENARYIRFWVQPAYGTTYNHDICINLSWDGERNGEYEPYVKHEYDYSGEREVERIVGYVDLGTLSWTKSSSGSYTFFYTPVSGIKRISTSSEFINLLAFGNYKSVAQSVWSSNFPCVCKLQGGNNNVLIADHNFDDKTAEEVATALSGTYLVYELATPYTETVSNPELRGIPKLDANNKLYYYGDTCSDLPNPQAVDDFGTEEYVDNREVAIPVGHDTFYQSNLRAKLEMAPDSPSGDGDYIVRQTGGQNEYVPLVKELPTLPSSNGTYTLKCTVSGSSKTLSWVADT